MPQPGGSAGPAGPGGAGEPSGLPGISGGAGKSGTAGTAGVSGGDGQTGTATDPDLFSSGGTLTQDAFQLVVTTPPPGSVAVGATFNMTVSIENSQGEVDTAFDGDVTVNLASNTGGAALGGTLTVTAANGVATFTGLTVNKTGNSYEFEATSGPATSAPATINVTSTPTPTPTPSPTPTPTPTPSPDSNTSIIGSHDHRGADHVHA